MFPGSLPSPFRNERCFINDDVLFHEWLASERWTCTVWILVGLSILAFGLYTLWHVHRHYQTLSKDQTEGGIILFYACIGISLMMLVLAFFMLVNSFVAPRYVYENSQFYRFRFPPEKLPSQSQSFDKSQDNPPSAVEVKSTPAASSE